MSRPYLTTVDRTRELKATLDSFKNDAVLVGIPEETPERKPTKPGDPQPQINNATILAINEFGSPLNNIPPSFPMTTGIFIARDAVAEEFRKAAVSALTGGLKALQTYYERAGTIAANSVKKVINDQIGFDPPSAATLKARKYLTKTGFKGTKRLIVTGQLRNAITYVLSGGR